jgi:Cft2 family RNA processing exonuclease
MEELEAFSGPKIVLASFPEMEFGFSRDLLLEWASKPDNTIILPSRGDTGTLARQLYDYWDGISDTEAVIRPIITSHIDIPLEV